MDRSFDSLVHQMVDRDPVLRPTAAEVVSRLQQIANRQTEKQPTSPVPIITRNTVGRSDHLDELHRLFQSAASQHGNVVCLAGEAGIGKTTLINEFLGRLVAEGHTHLLLRGACSERLFGADGLLPLLEALSGLLDGEYRQRGTEMMRRLAPAWFVRLASREALLDFPDNEIASARVASQERLKRELLSLLQNLSRFQPLVLVIDDLHWVDPSTADMVTYLASRSAELSLLIIAGYRPTEMALHNQQFNKAKLDLQSRGLFHDMPLKFLGRHDVGTYLDLAYPNNEFNDDFAELIHRRTEGSPLFVVNLLKYLEEQQVMAESDGKWKLIDSAPEIRDKLPESVRSMIQKNVEHLNASDRDLLVAASVQGGEFHGVVISRALDRDEVEVEERLEELERIYSFVRTVREEEFPDGTATLRYAFVHILYQNSLFTSLTPARRARLARKVADALAALHVDQSGWLKVASELAILYEVARDFLLASDHFLLASKNAERNAANQEAITLAERSMTMADRLRGADKTERILKATFWMARIAMNLGRFEQGATHFDAAVNIAESANDVDAQTRAMCGKASCLFFMKQLDESRSIAAQALELAELHQLETVIAMAKSALALERLSVGDFEPAERLYDKAIPVLESSGETRQALDAMAFRMLMHAWQLNYKPFDSGMSELEQRTLEQGGNLVQLYFFRAMALGNQGHLSDAYRLITDARRLADLNDDQYHIPRLPNTEGWLLREMGDLEGALRVDEESLQLGVELGHDEAAANACVNLAHALTDLGDHDQALCRLQEAEQMFERDVWFRWRYSIRLQAEFSRHYMARGDLGKAEHYAQLSLDAANKATARKHIAFALSLFGQVAVQRDDMQTANRHFATALMSLENHPCPSIEWRIHQSLAKVEEASHRNHDAERHRQLALDNVDLLGSSIKDSQRREEFHRRIQL